MVARRPALVLVIVMIAIGLAGCLGSSGGSPEEAPQGDDPAEGDRPDGNETRPDEGDRRTGDAGDDEASEPARVPSDAMEGEPADTEPGMAHFTFEGDGAVDVFGTNSDSVTFTVSDPGDLTFFDAYLHSDADQATWDEDYDLYLYEGNGTDGEPIAEGATSTTEGYLFWKPDGSDAQEYTLEVESSTSKGEGWTLDVWAWTKQNWSANHPWTDVWQREYEFGQLEVCGPEPVCVSGTIGWTYGPAARQLTGDDSWDVGGYIWYGCTNEGSGTASPNGTSTRSLPCPEDEPYTSVSVVIDDDVQGQQVAAIWTTCSNDGDIYCGETNNRNDTKCDGDCAGPNELQATFCGTVSGITRDGTTDADGTGTGVWDQRGELYQAANGTYVPHPGVEDMVLFLVGPQRGGGGICPQANPYTGPVRGTITIIATK